MLSLSPPCLLVVFCMLTSAISCKTTSLVQQEGLVQVVALPELPAHLTFCKERVPLERADVAQALERELITNIYLHASTIQLLLRSASVLPKIKALLMEARLPEDLAYIAVAESALRTEALSSAGAAGVWQFMEATGREYGLVITPERDERYAIEPATRAAILYLQKAYATFGSWTDAAASYNRGMNGYRKAQESQYATSYYDLWLNPETARYVYRILALKVLLESPTKYGYHLPQREQNPLKQRTVEVSSSIDDLPAFAKEHGTTYKMLRQLNPWLRALSLPLQPHEHVLIYLPSQQP